MGGHVRLPRPHVALLAAPARPHGDGDGGGDLRFRGADGRRRRHVQPEVVADRRVPRHGRRVDARGCVLGPFGDHRALGLLGLVVHVHERCLPGMDHRRGWPRERGTALPEGRASPVRWRRPRVDRAGRRRRRLAPRRSGRRRGGDGLVRRVVHLVDAGDRLPTPASHPASLRIRRNAADRRCRRSLCVGGAGDPAPRRGGSLHGHIQRGVRPAQGSTLPARRRAAGGRAAGRRSLVRDLLAGRDGPGVRSDNLADQALRARRAQGRHELAPYPDDDGDGGDARLRAHGVDLGRDRRAPRSLSRT